MPDRHRLRLGLPLGLALLAASPAWAADLALKRVMLSSGGVGYFEYEAEIDGAETLDLTVRRDQVDDVLKSVVIYDDKGGVGDVALPGEDPLADVFRELPFDQGALQDPARLYNALRGAEVEIGGATAIRGRIIGVTEEVESAPQGRSITRHRLSILTDTGVRTLLLSDAGPISFADPKLKAQVSGALEALVRNRAKERRTLSVRTFGTGKRTLRVAYVVEAPLWKAAYRLTLGGGATADLQGWAVLENRSGEDWKDVELTLVTGNPVTFRQALYTAYYVRRPEVPVEVMGRVLPRADSGTAMAMAASAPRPQAAAAPPMPQRSMVLSAPVEVMQASKRAAEIVAAESEEATTQASYTIAKPVTVENGHSLLVPLIARAVPAEKVAIYQRQPESHPLAAVRITNDGTVSLPPGVLTLYERDAKGAAGFVGDARLTPMPAGEKRLLSFAVDQKVTVRRSQETTRTLSSARLRNGVLQASLVDRITTTYDLSASPGEARRVLTDHPRTNGFDLVEPKGSVEQGAGGYRLPVAIEAGKPARLVVVEERTVAEQVALTRLGKDDFLQYAANGKLTEAQRKAFTKIAQLTEAKATAAEAGDRLTARRKELEGEQVRIRSNLGGVPANSDLARRYIATLGEQEDKFAALDVEIAKAKEAERAAEAALTDYLRGLDL